MTENDGGRDITPAASLKIKVKQISQDPSRMTSQVLVQGIMVNNSPDTLAGSCTGCSIGGDQNFIGFPFDFTIDAGQTLTFISHTFTCDANNRGNTHVSFKVTYGYTGTLEFGNNQSVSGSLDLDKIKTVPTAPQNLGYSGLTPTSVTLDWDPPDDTGGYTIQYYVVNRYDGNQSRGKPQVTYKANASTRSISDMVPGQEYTFTVQAVTKAQHNGGYSTASGDLTLISRTGVFMRYVGEWVRVEPYIRNGGVWLPAQTLVRDGGLWKDTNN